MSNSLDTTKLLADANVHRLVLQATLVPVMGDLFQPAGFPDIGHVIYDAPRPIMEETGEGKDKKLVQAKDTLGNLKWSKEKVCIVDSAASMANHLEAVSLASAQTLELHPDLAGMPYVECYTDEGWPTVRKQGPHRLVVTSLSEGHRLASNYFIGAKSKKKTKPVYLVKNDQVTDRELITEMKEAMGINDLDNRSHPLPADWWDVFRTIFRYDPNSLVHGILFPALGIKISRVLTAHHEAFGADRVGLSGVKFDKLQKTNSGQPIFSVDQETAREIRATFVIDLSLIRSFGHDQHGLNNNQKQFLLELSLWKIGRLLADPYRFRSGCDLKCSRLVRIQGEELTDVSPSNLGSNLKALVINGEDEKGTNSTSIWLRPDDAGNLAPIQKGERITKVYWPANDLFKKPSKDDEDEGGEEGTTDNEDE